MRRFSFPGLLSSLTMAAMLVAAPARLPADEPYEIDVLLPITGGGAFLGKEDTDSLGVVETLVNKSGGIKGRPIHFKIYDDQTNPQVAVQLANEIIAKNVPVFLGPQLVGGCNAVLPLLKTGPVMYCLSPGLYSDVGSYGFSGNIATRDMLAVTVRFYREKGWTKIGVLSPTDATGQDGDRSIDAAFADPDNHAMSIVAREHFNTSDLSVTAQMSRLKAAGAQAIIAWVTGTALSTTLRGAADAGVDLPIVTSTGNLVYPQLEGQASVIGDNIYFPATPGDALNALPNGPLHTAVANYLDAMKAAGIKPDQGHTLAWDPAWIVVSALRQLGTNATATQVRDYIAGIKGYVGINGVYDFHASPQRGLNATSVIMVRWLKAKDTWVVESQPGGALLK